MYMISLSASELCEISAFPNLLALVENACVLPKKTDEYIQLCAQHNCVENVLHILPHSSFAPSPLTFLARFDRWNIVQRMDVTQFSTNDWQKAIRRAGKDGHMEFVDNILKICDNTDVCVRTVVLGASMNDQVKVLQRFLPAITDQGFLGHVAVIAAQHGSIDCVRYCLGRITSQQWLGVLSACVDIHRCDIKIANMLLDHQASYSVTPQWCIKFTKRMAHISTDKADQVWRFVLQHMPWNDVEKIVSHWSDERKQFLRNVQQNVVLSQTVDGSNRSTPKRKM